MADAFPVSPHRSLARKGAGLHGAVKRYRTESREMAASAGGVHEWEDGQEGPVRKSRRKKTASLQTSPLSPFKVSKLSSGGSGGTPGGPAWSAGQCRPRPASSTRNAAAAAAGLERGGMVVSYKHQCTRCARSFSNIKALNAHMKKHKNADMAAMVSAARNPYI